MILSDHDLLQMDEAYLESLDPDRLRAVSKKLLSDLKESRERLNQNSQNSSIPPSSRPAYLGTLVGSDDQEKTSSEDEGDPPSKKGKLKIDPTEDSHKSDAVAESGTTEQSGVTPQDGKNVGGKAGSNSLEPKKAGKQLGAQGYGRTQVIPHNKLEEHRATQCSACGEDLPHDAPFVAKTGFRVIDIKQNDDDQRGVELECVLHHFGETECGCGHRTLVMPGRGDSHESANTSLSEWRLIGPRLAIFIVFLTFRMRLSRARVKELLWEWLGLQLATGTIDNCIRESALAALPIYVLLAMAVPKEPLVQVDETPWNEKGSIPWLWVFISSTIVLFVIGKRQQEVLLSILTAGFSGWLMSDGLGLYRMFPKRLRCLAHLIRKARGLAESLTEEAREFGEVALAVLEAVFEHRLGTMPMETVQQRLASFRESCKLVIEGAEHKKTRELAGEFLRDWDAIWKVVEHPELPATNNEAERILRHWVIARQISHGTRTADGSQAVAVLASIIETCRLRGVKTWDYLTQVIATRRRGEEPLPLPAVA
jgi:transposase